MQHECIPVRSPYGTRLDITRCLICVSAFILWFATDGYTPWFTADAVLFWLVGVLLAALLVLQVYTTFHWMSLQLDLHEIRFGCFATSSIPWGDVKSIEFGGSYASRQSWRAFWEIDSVVLASDSLFVQIPIGRFRYGIDLLPFLLSKCSSISDENKRRVKRKFVTH